MEKKLFPLFIVAFIKAQKDGKKCQLKKQIERRKFDSHFHHSQKTIKMAKKPGKMIICIFGNLKKIVINEKNDFI